MLLTFLIILFASIILYKILSFIFFGKIIEGMTDEYQEYDKNDPLILAQQNAGNIDYLKSRMDELNGVKNDVNEVKQSMQTMQIQIDELVQQQADMAVELSGGGEPVAVDGLDEEDGTIEEDGTNEE